MAKKPAFSKKVSESEHLDEAITNVTSMVLEKGTTTTSKEDTAETGAPVATNDEDAAEEVWDITRVIRTTNKDTDASTPTPGVMLFCRTEDCSQPACAVWAGTIDPSDEWPLCVECQERDFGGWPIEMDPSKDKTLEVEHHGIDDKTITPNSAREDHDHHEEKAVSDNEVDRVEDVVMKESVSESHTRTPVGSQATFPSKIATEMEESPTSVPLEENEDTPEKKDDDSTRVLDASFRVAEGTATGADTGEDVEEVWEVKKIMTATDMHDFPVKCSTETCVLPAACIYISNLAPTVKWYSCLDCQETDFGGWPDVNELPISEMTLDHKNLLIDKCSRKKDAIMPEFPNTSSSTSMLSPGKNQKPDTISNTMMTPPPTNDFQKAGGVALSTVTPSPATTTKNAAVKPPPSKQALALHRKWQEGAEALGGPEARIVVSKPAAKKIIFDFLVDTFAPMNITQIHKGLKAIVPSPVLKACLDDMVFDKNEEGAFDSDDEEKPAKKKIKLSDDPYASSLCFKAGRSSNNTLYYVDHTKLENNGDGLTPDDRNELHNKAAKVEAEEAALIQTLKSLKMQTAKLLSEPTNEEATKYLEEHSAALAKIEAQVQAAQKLKVNEKHKKQVSRQLSYMTAQWRSRRRTCMDFLIAMEENTDGSVSVKKCLAGDGQIDIDSDEAVAQGALEYAKKKKRPKKMAIGQKRSVGVSSKHTVKQPATLSGLPLSESIVAVLLDSAGCVKCVHLDDEDE